MAMTFDIIGSVSRKKAWIGAGAVDRGGLERLLRQRAQARQHDQHHEGRPLPDIGEQHAAKRRRARGEDRILRRQQAERIERAAEHAEGAVEHQQEHHGGDGGRHDQRQGHERAQHAVALAVGIEQQRDQQAEHQLDDEGDAGIEEGVVDRVPDALVAEGLEPVGGRDRRRLCAVTGLRLCSDSQIA